MESAIPIRNLYHLLCYAWDRLEERELIDVATDAPPRDTLNLLGRVLANGVRALVRRGFERGYLERREELTALRGRLAVVPTARRQLARHGRAECVFDELEHDTPANRVILSTLTLLLRSPLVDAGLRHDLAALARAFRDVRLVRVAPADCRRVTVHRNNRHYGFLLELCALVLDLAVPDENGALTRFRDFARDHRAMSALFENFVRNFYAHHAAELGLAEVGKERFGWHGTPEPGPHVGLWPDMEADICLRRTAGPPLVIDCKFYTEALKENRHGQRRLESAHLYQVFAYARNLAPRPGWESVEGLLIYAETGTPFDVAGSFCGRRLRAASLDLDRPWPEIHARLADLVAAPRPASAPGVFPCVAG